MLELNLAIRPIMWKNMANYLERIQIFIIFAACSLKDEPLTYGGGAALYLIRLLTRY